MATPNQFIAALKKYMGVPYVFGGKTSKGLDCSGLITLALADVGVKFPHGSVNQINATTAISVDRAWRTPGALLYRPGHDAISLGDGTAIEAIRPRVAITKRTATLNGKPRFTRAGLIAALQKGETMAGMVSPAQGRFSSGYGKRNLAVAPWHAGVDIANVIGTPVYAPFAGTVRGVGANLAPGRSGDRNILISNPDGEGQYFGHLNKALVKIGQKVKAGQKIGEIGARGNVTGPHLHFETWSNWRNSNSHFDPMILFKKYGVAIGSRPKKTGGGGTPPKKEKWFDMDEKEFFAAMKKFFMEDWITVGGELGKKYKGGKASLYELTREGAYSREEVRKVFMEKFPIYGALKNYTGGDEMNLIQFSRYGATAMVDGRNQHTRIMAELAGLEAGISALAKAVETGSGPDMEAILEEINAAAQEAARAAMPDEVVVPLEIEE